MSPAGLKPADFRSDTVTRPSAAMRRAMAEAEVGDDVLDGDPTVRRLQHAAAAWLGKEGALFVPSGTMANQLAIGVRCRPGDEVIVAEDAHVATFESGAIGGLHGAQTRTLPTVRGALAADDVRRAIRPDFVHCPETALVCVEQTHMGSGGRVVPLDALRAVRDVAHAAGVPVHLDGARLAHAVVASGTDAATWAACADTVSLCFSKGLGAPVGSVVAGDAAFLESALRLRKRLGGWMRQSGVLAAPALLALETGVERLEQDHALARELAAVLARFDALRVDPDDVETNLVLVRVEHDELDARALSARLADEGVLVLPLAPDVLRFVTHLDVGPDDVRRLAAALERVLGAG